MSLSENRDANACLNAVDPAALSSNQKGVFSRCISGLRLLVRWLKNDSVSSALSKLIFQTTTLFTYLNEGFPLAIVFIYSVVLLGSWVFSGYRSLHIRSDPNHARVLFSFDTFFAVFAPMGVLMYACTNFSFERALFAARIAALPLDSFDRTARLFADPTETSFFRIAFQHLQCSTWSSLLIRALLNVFSIVKWYHVIDDLFHHHGAIDAHSTCQNKPNIFKGWRRVYRNVMGVSFILAGSLLFVYSVVAVISSRHVCSPYAQCIVASHQWNIGSNHCPCIVFVDRQPIIKTFAEWDNPPDTTRNLSELAFLGRLKVVQIINRALPWFPNELRKCRQLEQLILVYTRTLGIPDWGKEFAYLEYLHIEGDLTSKHLTYMPHDLFKNMPRLIFIHFGCLTKLPALPAFNMLKRLKYLVLTMIHSIQDIPAVDEAVNLRRLVFLDNVRLLRLPRVNTLIKLNTFAVSYRTPVCCNGFIFDKCDLSAFSCLDRTYQGEPLIHCSADHIDPIDYNILITTDGLVCPPNLDFDLKDLVPTEITVDQACGGVIYKECTALGKSGICYPARMQPISCQLDPAYRALRRFEIERSLGTPCDPSVEGWLGCP